MTVEQVELACGNDMSPRGVELYLEYAGSSGRENYATTLFNGQGHWRYSFWFYRGRLESWSWTRWSSY